MIIYKTRFQTNKVYVPSQTSLVVLLIFGDYKKKNMNMLYNYL
jgi:hypothetical protein